MKTIRTKSNLKTRTQENNMDRSRGKKILLLLLHADSSTKREAVDTKISADFYTLLEAKLLMKTMNKVSKRPVALLLNHASSSTRETGAATGRNADMHT